MLWFFRFLKGYLTIRIGGECAERLLNRAMANKINIWNLRYKNGYIYGNILINNFLKLHKIRSGIKCRVSILEKHGLVFILKKYKNRLGLVVGLSLFFSILFFLSNFIWIINVEGNSNISTAKIISSCKKIGIFEGVFKNKVNNKYDAQRLLLTQEGVAWCSLNIEGCVLTVNLSETAISDKKNRETPMNLKAKFDGKIKTVDVSYGDVVVKVGDIVSRGDLLVSGIIENSSYTSLVHSSGIIIAETQRVFSSKGDFVQTIEKETGKKIRRYTLEFFGVKIPLYFGNIKNTHKYTKEIRYLTLFGSRIPIKIACEDYIITEKLKVRYDENTLQRLLFDDIKKQTDAFDFIDIVERDKELIHTDTGILLKITYICQENIAVEDEILLSK